MENSPMLVGRKNILFLAILIFSTLVVVPVFSSGEFTSWLISGNSTNGLGAQPTLDYSYSYCGSNINLSCNFNISMNITFVNDSFHLAEINLSALNATGVYFAVIGPSNNTSRIGLPSGINSANGVGLGGAKSVNLSNTTGAILNLTQQQTGLNDTTAIMFQTEIDFDTEGIYFFTMNLTTNITGTAIGEGNRGANTSNFTILADWTTPVLNATYINDSDNIALFNQTVNITFNVSDDNLNWSQLGTDQGGLNITFYNATSNSTTGFLFYIQPANISNVSATGGPMEHWNFSVGLRPNGTQAVPACPDGTRACELNLTARIVLDDNASNGATRYWGSWVLFDNQSPTVASTSPTNNTQNVIVSSNILINFSEMLNINSISNLTALLYKTGDNTNVSRVITYANSSNKGVITLNPDSALSYDTNYTVNISYTNSSNQIKDLAGNHVATNHYVITFKTQAAPSSVSSTPGGDTTAAAGAANIVVETIKETEAEKAVTAVTGNMVTVSFGGGETHTITVSKITGATVTLTITPTPITVNAIVGKTVYVDINKDGANDIAILVKRLISADKIEMVITKLRGAKKVAEEVVRAREVLAPAPAVTPKPAAKQAPAGLSTADVLTPTPEAAKPIPITTILLSAVVATITISGVGYVYAKHEKARQLSKPTPLPDEKIVKYIQAQLTAGHSELDIIKALKKSGHFGEEILVAWRRISEYATAPPAEEKIVKYLREQLVAGYSKSAITTALKRAGYADEKIHVAWGEISEYATAPPAEEKIVKYIQKQLSSGYSKSAIITVLKRTGYADEKIHAAWREISKYIKL